MSYHETWITLDGRQPAIQSLGVNSGKCIDSAIEVG
jgi:hypothetical protein